MSQIDLGAQSFAPAVTGLLFSFFSGPVVACILLTINFIATVLLYFFLKNLYESWPRLSDPKSPARKDDNGDSDNVKNNENDFKGSLKLFQESGCAGVMMSYSFLFLTVLSFDTIMTVYLLFMGMTEFNVGVCRGVSAFIGFIGASIYPYAKESFGLWTSGSIALIWQSAFVGVAALSFCLSPSMIAIIVLTVCVLISRIGLWLFDLCARQICQETIRMDARGTVNGMWQSIQNTFELSAYALTMLFSLPQQFSILACISFFMVFSATVNFIVCARYSESSAHTKYKEIVGDLDNVELRAGIKSTSAAE